MKSTIPSRIWETKRVLITKLYEEEEWPLKQVIRALQSKDFHPSETQLRSRLKKWHVTKPSRKKWSTNKRPTSDDSSTLRSPETGHHHPGRGVGTSQSHLPDTTSLSPLASQGLSTPACAEAPCFPPASSFIQPLAYTQSIPESGIGFETVRRDPSGCRLPSQPARFPSGTQHEPGGSVYRWPACFDPLGLGTAASAPATSTDPLLSSLRHPPIVPSMGYPKASIESNPTAEARPTVPRIGVQRSKSSRGTQPGRHIVSGDGEENEGLGIYGAETNFLLEGYPAWIGPYDVYSVGSPSPSKVSYLQPPPLWPVGDTAVSDGNRY
ncbi:hypothetical protein P170DRAFT_512840 [Aspergillus steynii IBT 23096]|uniref:Clr5 domain-containing protein n=1 Tax=Aspergillus steynii IBT 23096 TaxID=1392250 RepID=A0A2I2G0C0_9EURO|nr:uncharacterized protein P170DRAFT_512840 [Aspergillus steynii IBT 23096]PLB46319.1 hypothetical protein P170DRAFT_512840 [Aspergillus steynii IBT 23096]